MSQQGVDSQIGVEVVHRSHVRVEAKPRGIKLVSLPAEPAPVPQAGRGKFYTARLDPRLRRWSDRWVSSGHFEPGDDNAQDSCR